MDSDGFRTYSRIHRIAFEIIREYCTRTITVLNSSAFATACNYGHALLRHTSFGKSRNCARCRARAPECSLLLPSCTQRTEPETAFLNRLLHNDATRRAPEPRAEPASAASSDVSLRRVLPALPSRGIAASANSETPLNAQRCPEPTLQRPARPLWRV